MTNRAVVSWSVTTVTEIMTIGFGDLYPQLERAEIQVHGKMDGRVLCPLFRNNKSPKLFKGHQIVLTTAPSDTAVILGQGQNKEGL